MASRAAGPADWRRRENWTRRQIVQAIADHDEDRHVYYGGCAFCTRSGAMLRALAALPTPTRKPRKARR